MLGRSTIVLPLDTYSRLTRAMDGDSAAAVTGAMFGASELLGAKPTLDTGFSGV